MNIVWRRPDGGISTTHLASNAGTPEEHAEELKQWGNIPEDWEVVATRYDLPMEHPEYFNAWEWHEQDGIIHNMGKAAEVTKERLRRERAPLLTALDVEHFRADEAGDTVAKAEISARKQALRDVTKRVHNRLTIEQMKAIKVGE